MKRVFRTGVFLSCAMVFGALLTFVTTRQPAAVGGFAIEEAKSGKASSYSVVMTEGHNLLVTDNAANKLFFYTIDKDKPIGSPLKLRASIDLTKVGGDEITITPHNVEK